MSENKDLKKANPNIREYHVILGELIEIENYHPNLVLQLQHIKAAASRMAKEVKTKDGALTFALLEVDRLKAENQRLQAIVENDVHHYPIQMEIENAKITINALKAELAKRPEVVRCGECSKHKQPSCPWHRALIMNDPNEAFCSYGQRRESEEK